MRLLRSRLFVADYLMLHFLRSGIFLWLVSVYIVSTLSKQRVISNLGNCSTYKLILTRLDDRQFLTVRKPANCRIDWLTCVWWHRMASSVDWDKGLPTDVLALLARGSDALKAMRAVCTSWKTGFDCSITTLKVSCHGPALPHVTAISERFPMLACLSLEGYPLCAAEAKALRGIRSLARLILGGEHDMVQPSDAVLKQLTGTPLTDLSLRNFGKLSDNSLGFLQGLPLSSIDLRGCPKLTDNAVEVLRGIPLTSLCLEARSLSSSGLEPLRCLPLTSLHLGIYDQLEDASLEPLREMPLKRLSLQKYYKNRLTDAGLAHLRGLPLSFLSLGGCELVTDSGLMEILAGMPLVDLALKGFTLVTEAGLEVRKSCLTYICFCSISSNRIGQMRWRSTGPTNAVGKEFQVFVFLDVPRIGNQASINIVVLLAHVV